MLAVAFVRWWYGDGWKLLAHNVQRRMQRTADSFSVPTLVRTMFSPWKRIITVPGSGIGAHLRAMGDNAVSRAVGFTVRLFVLISAGLCLLFMGIAGILQILLWPVVPGLVVLLIIKGLV